LVLAAGGRMSIEFSNFGAGSPSHRGGDGRRRSNVAISGARFVYQVRSRHYDKGHYVSSDVGIVQSSCGNARRGWTGQRSYGRDGQHFSKPPGFVRIGGGYIKHCSYRRGIRPHSDRTHCEPRQSDDNGDRPDGAAHCDSSLTEALSPMLGRIHLSFAKHFSLPCRFCSFPLLRKLSYCFPIGLSFRLLWVSNRKRRDGRKD
jgi:hypothetical protein